ncbi:alpha/beta hydrolase family protein [Lysobacter antibioticus]|uniref:Prolyl oligopeptidase family protein n=1 Tax=Lysobacter antibioticus TaxID=84531 RepID=A0A0S2F8Q0_LYSAN|nr:S9 family peptidase [Lysobacter antibioticus]ALN79841.1 prolyl oligopeptidase family protein [Lysobacter antibioticus]
MTPRHAFLPMALLLACASAPAFSLTPPLPRGLEVRDLATMDRVSSPTLSADGRQLVFAQRSVDFAANKSSTSLWIEDLFARDAAPPKRLTPEGWNVNSPSFSPDGKLVYFLSAKSGSSQLYSIDWAGRGAPRQLTAFDGDVGGYQISPDGKRVAFNTEAYAECAADLACTKKKLDAAEKNKASGMVFDRMFIRHWDAWNDGRLNRLFVSELPVAGKTVATAKLIGADVIGDVPSRPFGDSSEYTWSPDGQSLVFSARKADAKEPWSTNFDLYLVAADGSGAAKNLTATNPAWDTGAVFAADGKTLYYRAMKRPGFEADRFGLFALDLASGKAREIAPDWDRSAENIVLSADGKTIYTLAQDVGQLPLFGVDIASGKPTRLIGDGSLGSPQLAGKTFAFTRNSLKSGDQIIVGGLDGAPERAITPSASQRLPGVRFGEYEQFDFKGWNGDTVHGYVVKPWNYQEGQKYPVAFLIHGGPQGSFGDGWSYRWNPQTYAGQGYAVVMIDFHGSTGYGQAFTDAISEHWGDRPLEDLQKGWAAAQKKYGFLNGDKACALGASYGGFMVNWIAGNWQQPWKCLVSHDGVFDQRMMGYATEELWFTEWEQGGTPYDVPKNYEKFNPVNHVKDWKVPMLVIHGQLDYRIPVEQGIGVFTALQRQGIESKFLYFPNENHWVLKPQNSVQWHDTVNGWLKQHIGE